MDIGPHRPPFIVAEIGANHGGSMQRARGLIDAAKEVDADCVKFQCYEADTITLNCDNPDFQIKDGPWKGRRLYELYKTTQTPFAWFPELATHAKKVGITWMASVFDRSSADLLERLDCAAYKIASCELTDTPLIKYVAAKGKPIILSTGMASDTEIAMAIMAAPPNAVLPLHCVSGYPTPLAEANLGRMHRGWGISDHTIGTEIPIVATALGAVLIEKHFRLKGYADTEDAAFSLTPNQFKQMVKSVRDVWSAMQPSTTHSEESTRQLRRSLYVVKDIHAGEHFTCDNIRSIRPAYGAHPRYLESLIGKPSPQNLTRGTPLPEELAIRCVSTTG